MCINMYLHNEVDDSHRRAIKIWYKNEKDTKWIWYFCCKASMDSLAQFQNIPYWLICWWHNLDNESYLKTATSSTVSQNWQYTLAYISRSLNYTLFFILYIFLLLFQLCLVFHLMKGCTKLFLAKTTLLRCAIL